MTRAGVLAVIRYKLHSFFPPTLIVCDAPLDSMASAARSYSFLSQTILSHVPGKRHLYESAGFESWTCSWRHTRKRICPTQPKECDDPCPKACAASRPRVAVCHGKFMCLASAYLHVVSRVSEDANPRHAMQRTRSKLAWTRAIIDKKRESNTGLSCSHTQAHAHMGDRHMHVPRHAGAGAGSGGRGVRGHAPAPASRPHRLRLFCQFLA